MNLFKKLIIFMLISIILFVPLKTNIWVSAQTTSGKTIKAIVLLSSFDDAYISLVHDNLDRIQKENPGKVEFIFFDGKDNQDIQNETIESVFTTDFDLLLANLVNLDEGTIESLINKVKSKNIPVIFFNVVPYITTSIKSYPKAVVIATNAEQSGILEGNIIINAWNNNKILMDKNKDNILQYIMLEDKNNNTLNTARTKYSVSKINEAGIKAQELAAISSPSTQSAAEQNIENSFLKYGNKIEAIIANNDTLAIGAIKALQKYGFNIGIASIPVVGIDAIPEARELIKRGSMLGTVTQDPTEMAEALFKVGINLVLNKSPLQGTNYKFDDTDFIIKLPYNEYKPQ